MQDSVPSRSAVVLSATSWISEEVPKGLDSEARRSLEELDREVSNWLEEKRAEKQFFNITIAILVMACIVNFCLAIGALLQ